MDALDVSLMRPKEFRPTEYREGLWRALVLNIDDPDSMGRIQVRVLQLHAEMNDALCPWATPCFPLGGSAEQGSIMIPPVDATVWIAFEQGHIGRPVWIGTWYGEEGLPTEVTKPGDNRIIKSPGGQLLNIQDSDPVNTKKIELSVSGGNQTMQIAEGDTIKISSLVQTDQNLELKDVSGVKTSTLEHGTGMSLKFTASGVVLSYSGGTIEIDSSGDVNIAATNINLGSGANLGVMLDSMIIAYNTHTHPGDSGGTTGVPNTPLVAGTHSSSSVNAAT